MQTRGSLVAAALPVASPTAAARQADGLALGPEGCVSLLNRQKNQAFSDKPGAAEPADACTPWLPRLP